MLTNCLAKKNKSSKITRFIYMSGFKIGLMLLFFLVESFLLKNSLDL